MYDKDVDATAKEVEIEGGELNPKRSRLLLERKKESSIRSDISLSYDIDSKKSETTSRSDYFKPDDVEDREKNVTFLYRQLRH